MTRPSRLPSVGAQRTLLACLALCLAPACAHAHAFLQHASPSVGSTVKTAPKEVKIDFTSGVEPTFSTIAVTNASGAEMDDGHVHPEGDSTLVIGLHPLPPGRYTVTWHAVAVDTHHTEGSFAFTVAP